MKAEKSFLARATSKYRSVFARRKAAAISAVIFGAAVSGTAAVRGVSVAPPALDSCGDALCVIAFGDSLMASSDLPPDDGFTRGLEKKLLADGYRVRVINASVAGDTSAHGLERLDAAVGAHADLAIVEFGANDLLKGVEMSVLHQNLGKIVARFQAEGVRVLLAGFHVIDAPMIPHYLELNAVYPEVAAESGVELHPNFVRGMTGEHGPLPSCMGVTNHPTALGVAKIVEDVAPFVERELRLVKRARNDPARLSTAPAPQE